MLTDKTYRIKDRIDHEIGFRGTAGRKGEKRSKRRKASPETIKRQNQWNRTKRLDRKIRANFEESTSLYITLTYKKELRPQTPEEFKADRKTFLDAFRKEYKKAGIPFKWISRAEIGKRGAAHLHFLINDIPGANMIALVNRYWSKGRPMIKPADDLESGTLAKYFTKLSADEYAGQTTWMDEKMQKAVTNYSCSRNLIEPEPEIKTYKRRTLEKAIREGIKPKKGYRILEDSIIYGVNPYTGNSYLHYSEVRANCAGALVKIPEWKEDPPWRYT